MLKSTFIGLQRCCWQFYTRTYLHSFSRGYLSNLL